MLILSLPLPMGMNMMYQTALPVTLLYVITSCLMRDGFLWRHRFQIHQLPFVSENWYQRPFVQLTRWTPRLSFNSPFVPFSLFPSSIAIAISLIAIALLAIPVCWDHSETIFTRKELAGFIFFSVPLENVFSPWIHFHTQMWIGETGEFFNPVHNSFALFF